MNKGLEKVSEILYKLEPKDGEMSKIEKARSAFKSVSLSCLDNGRSIAHNFEKMLEEYREKEKIEEEIYRILKRNIEEIIDYFMECFKLKKIERNEIKKVTKEELIEENRCAICVDVDKKKDIKYIVNCNHEFGEKCLKEWQKVRNSCPLCRGEAGAVGCYKLKI